MQPLPGVRHHEGTDGAWTSGGPANAESLIKLLNDALATKAHFMVYHEEESWWV
jgi:hypothetical protein